MNKFMITPIKPIAPLQFHDATYDNGNGFIKTHKLDYKQAHIPDSKLEQSNSMLNAYCSNSLLEDDVIRYEANIPTFNVKA